MNGLQIFGASLRFKKAPKKKKTGYKASNRRPPRSRPLLEQPVAELNGAVPCLLCGHSVDAKRMHAHMVRFHGVAFSANPV
jgi:hypothetical protein